MIRAISLAAALAVGMTVPVLAADSTEGVSVRNLFTETQARQHLFHLGYTNVSGLTKDADGKWVGTATTKDGQTRAVAVDIRGPAAPAQSATN